ncbi:hypothetical protein SK128_020205 [Halocaridina rubra]|uniref:Trissin n=1 Tax=Halocaridina rubra TaxID=373956 RepID=A0AAN8XF57_HALRR
MHTFALFLAWAVVSGATAWSSSEVSCGSCGLECQKACGTRNFRACCFNFQRRRRSQISSPFNFYSLKYDENPDSSDITSLLRAPLSSDQKSSYIHHSLSSVPQDIREEPEVSPVIARKRYSQHLSSMLPAYLQESSEEEDVDENDVFFPSRENVNDRPSTQGASSGITDDSDEVAISRLLLMGLHRPSLFHKNRFQRRYVPLTSNSRK